MKLPYHMIKVRQQ